MTDAARRIETALDWESPAFARETRAGLDGLRRALAGRQGRAALFHGPPGTGKTLAAALLGKAAGREARRVDLSAVVSKYIGETEKNLARLFETAARRGWVLFFDEADALFGERSGVTDSHDRYAGLEVGHLLKRIETYKGLAILAANRRETVDPAILRRFAAVIAFPDPGAKARAAMAKGWTLGEA